MATGPQRPDSVNGDLSHEPFLYMEEETAFYIPNTITTEKSRPVRGEQDGILFLNQNRLLNASTTASQSL